MPVTYRVRARSISRNCTCLHTARLTCVLQTTVSGAPGGRCVDVATTSGALSVYTKQPTMYRLEITMVLGLTVK